MKPEKTLLTALLGSEAFVAPWSESLRGGRSDRGGLWTVSSKPEPSANPPFSPFDGLLKYEVHAESRASAVKYTPHQSTLFDLSDYNG